MSASEIVHNINLNTHLECPVCRDFAVSPIHTCKNGHIVCGICVEKTKICPTCRADKLIVCDFVERVLKAEGVVVRCRNSQHGCTRLVAPSRMKTHLADSCDFRPIACRTGWNLCGGKSYHPDELFKHWVDIHKIVKGNLILPSSSSSSNFQKGLLGTAKCWLSLSEEECKKECTPNAKRVSWKVKYVEIDGRVFFLHFICEEGNFKAWVTFLGMESDANKYGFVATLGSFWDTPEKRMTFPKTPVHSLQYGYACMKKIDDLGHTVAVSVKSLKLIRDKKLSDPKYALEWKVGFDIFSQR